MLVQFNCSDLLSRLGRITVGLENAVARGLTDAGRTGTERAQTVTYYRVRSPSGLQAHTLYRERGPLERHIIADRFYARWVDQGNGPPGSRIYPKRAKALRFVLNGEVVFRKWVRASTPRPFMTRTLEFEKQYLPLAVGRSVETFLKRV